MTHGRSDLSVAVIEAVAEESDTDPLQLPERLNTVIDPDALDLLFNEQTTDGAVRFQFNGYQVTATSNGLIEIEPAHEINTDES